MPASSEQVNNSMPGPCQVCVACGRDPPPPPRPTALQAVALLQKRIVSRCNQLGKPVLITRVVDTMVTVPRPTRAGEWAGMSPPLPSHPPPPRRRQPPPPLPPASLLPLCCPVSLTVAAATALDVTRRSPGCLVVFEPSPTAALPAANCLPGAVPATLLLTRTHSPHTQALPLPLHASL